MYTIKTYIYITHIFCTCVSTYLFKKIILYYFILNVKELYLLKY